MKRVMIIGFSGAGKSTLAREVAEKIGCGPTHMDKFHWLPGWRENSRDNEEELLARVLKQEKWVIDGNYIRIFFEGRLFLADTVIFLDFNRFLCFRRVVKRRFAYGGQTRPDITAGCGEKLDFEFMRRVLYEGRKKRDIYYKALGDIRTRHPEKRIFIFRRPREVRTFLDNIERID